MPEEPKTGTRTDQDPKEPKLRLRAKEHIVIDAVLYKPGEEFELPEREALGLVGQGQAEQVGPGETAAESKKRDEELARDSGIRDIDKVEDQEKKQPPEKKHKR